MSCRGLVDNTMAVAPSGMALLFLLARLSEGTLSHRSPCIGELYPMHEKENHFFQRAENIPGEGVR